MEQERAEDRERERERETDERVNLLTCINAIHAFELHHPIGRIAATMRTGGGGGGDGDDGDRTKAANNSTTPNCGKPFKFHPIIK